jgi:cytochrome bd-type quinol oxidase subunit 1
MDDPVLISRWQFAFTIVYHYLFPQLTMGLALLLVVLKSLYLRRGLRRRASRPRRLSWRGLQGGQG